MLQINFIITWYIQNNLSKNIIYELDDMRIHFIINNYFLIT